MVLVFSELSRPKRTKRGSVLYGSAELERLELLQVSRFASRQNIVIGRISQQSHPGALAPVEVVVRVTLTRWRRFSARAPCERAMRSCSARESSGCVPEPSRPRFESRAAFISQPRVCSHWQTVRDRVFWSSDPHVLYPRSPRPIADHSPSTPPRLFPTHRPAAPGA